MSEQSKDRELYNLQSRAIELNFYRGYYGQLVGAKVVGIQMNIQENDEYFDPLHYEVWPAIIFEKDGQRFTCELSADEEGNGPGFMFGLMQTQSTDEMIKKFHEASKDELVEAVKLLCQPVEKEFEYIDVDKV